MPELRTDDGPRKLRAIWLGPKGATLPFEWTYVQWSVTLAMIPAGVLIVAGVIALAGVMIMGHPPWFAFPFGIIYGGPAAVYGAIRLMRGVDFDEPLRYKISTARDELGRRSRQPVETPTNWLMPWPNLRELTDLGEQQLRADDLADDQAGSTAGDATP
jgi:hypothetical protein